MAASDKPEPAQALLVTNGRSSSFDSWLFRFWSWVTNAIDEIFATKVILSEADPNFPNARVATSSTSISVDIGTTGQIEWDLNTEFAQDLVGAMAADSTTVNSTYDDATGTISHAVITQFSITSDANGIKLEGDVASPGNNKVFGTDASGVKGWQTAAATLLSDGNGMAFAARHG